LTSVFYLGSNIITKSEVFILCDFLKNICVSPDYNSSEFCGRTVNSTSTLCQTFQNVFSHCSNKTHRNDIIREMNDDNDDWDKETYVCTLFECNNENKRIEISPVNCNKDCYISYCNESNGQCEYERIDGWQELITQENECYEVICDGNKWILSERENASKWEKQSNECIHYQCNNDTGFMKWSMCNSTVNNNRTCVNNKCIDDHNLNENKWVIEIEMEDVKAIDVNMTEVIDSIATLTGVNENDITVGMITDENGYVISIVVYVDSEETTNSIVEAINNIDKGELCEYGVLCKTYAVTVKGIEDRAISNGYHLLVNIFCMIITMIILLIL